MLTQDLRDPVELLLRGVLGHGHVDGGAGRPRLLVGHSVVVHLAEEVKKIPFSLNLSKKKYVPTLRCLFPSVLVGLDSQLFVAATREGSHHHHGATGKKKKIGKAILNGARIAALPNNNNKVRGDALAIVSFFLSFISCPGPATSTESRTVAIQILGVKSAIKKSH